MCRSAGPHGVCRVALQEEDADYASDVRTMVQAGEDAYQLVLSHGTSGAGSMVSANVLYDFSNFQDVDLSAPYWNREIMDMAHSLLTKIWLGIMPAMAECPW